MPCHEGRARRPGSHGACALFVGRYFQVLRSAATANGGRLRGLFHFVTPRGRLPLHAAWRQLALTLDLLSQWMVGDPWFFCHARST